MGDNTCGCCGRPQRDTIAAVVLLHQDGAPCPVMVKLCMQCRHDHWRRVGTWLALASGHLYERTGPCSCRAT